MPQFGGGSELEHSQYVQVAASQTTAQVSRISDATMNRDYLHRVILNYASSAAGAVTIYDGTTALLTIPALAGGDSRNYALDIGVTATSTKGFNITTGSSVAVVAVGRFFA